jgi:deoxyadenosine/deoxycytidine kinase
MAPFLISLEGNIGSGKTTILNHLKSNLRVAGSRRIAYVEEPLDQWQSITNKENVSMLELFYKDPKKYAFSFQMMAYISRLANLQDAIKKYPNHIIFMERSLLTDYHVFAKMLHDSGDLLDEEYTIYKRWFSHFNNIQMDALVYIHCSPEVSHERCKNRNRTGETISLEYMTKVHERHEHWIHEIDNRPLLVVENDTTSIDDTLFCIEDFLDDLVIPDDSDHFMEKMYSSYAYSRLILLWFLVSVFSFLKKA